MIDRSGGQNPVNALDGRVGVLHELRDGRVVDFLLQTDNERIQVLAELLDVSLVETREKRLRVGDNLAGETRRGRNVCVFGGPLKFERRMLRWVEEIDREILLACDACELGLGS